MSDEADKMFANLQEKTGKSRADWVQIAQQSGLEKHGQILAHLKTEHGMTHGFANLVTLAAMGNISGEQDGDALIDAQYNGKKNLRPIYQALADFIATIDADYEIAPKKAGVSFRRKKQFVLVEPKTKTRVDIGINLKNHPGTDRLKPVGGMCTHKVGITDVAEIDTELKDWITDAFHAAG